MSLKAFHIIFIAVSTCLAAGFTVWCIGRYQVDGQTGYLLAAAAGIAGATGLLYYGIRFARKIKDIRFQ